MQLPQVQRHNNGSKAYFFNQGGVEKEIIVEVEEPRQSGPFEQSPREDNDAGLDLLAQITEVLYTSDETEEEYKGDSYISIGNFASTYNK